MSSATAAPVSTSGDTQNPGGFPHVPALDGIRGLAILLVLFHHLFVSNTQTGALLTDLFSRLHASSWIGVNIFFALSGFLITGILVDTVHLPDFFKKFYARRSLRIFPLYYAALFIIFALTIPLGLHWNGWQYFYLTYSANLAVTKTDPLQLGPFNINHFWSLCVEEQFYILWPFLVYKVRNIRKLISLTLILSVVILCLRTWFVLRRAHFGTIYMPYSPTYSCADNLLLGCSLSLLIRTNMREKVLRLAPRVFSVTALIVVGFFIANRGLEWQSAIFLPTIGFSVIALMSTSLVACALRARSLTQRFFESPTLRFFGKYSYGIYVFHYSLDNVFTTPIRVYLREHLHSKSLAVLGAAIVVFALTIPLALLSYHLFEVHFLKLKKYFGYARSPAVA